MKVSFATNINSEADTSISPGMLSFYLKLLLWSEAASFKTKYLKKHKKNKNDDANKDYT